MHLISGRKYGDAYEYEEEEEETQIPCEAEKSISNEEGYTSLQNDFVDDLMHGEAVLSPPLDESLDEAESLTKKSDEAETSQEEKRKEIAEGKRKVGESSSQEQPIQQGDESPKR